MNWTDWMTVLHVGQRGLRRTLSMIRYRKDSLYGEASRISIRLGISKREKSYRPKLCVCVLRSTENRVQAKNCSVWLNSVLFMTTKWSFDHILTNRVDQIDVSLISSISNNIQAIAFMSLTFIVSLFHFVTSAAFSLIIIDHCLRWSISLFYFIISQYRTLIQQNVLLFQYVYNIYNSNTRDCTVYLLAPLQKNSKCILKFAHGIKLARAVTASPRATLSRVYHEIFLAREIASQYWNVYTKNIKK